MTATFFLIINLPIIWGKRKTAARVRSLHLSLIIFVGTDTIILILARRCRALISKMNVRTKPAVIDSRQIADLKSQHGLFLPAKINNYFIILTNLNRKYNLIR